MNFDPSNLENFQVPSVDPLPRSDMNLSQSHTGNKIFRPTYKSSPRGLGKESSHAKGVVDALPKKGLDCGGSSSLGPRVFYFAKNLFGSVLDVRKWFELFHQPDNMINELKPLGLGGQGPSIKFKLLLSFCIPPPPAPRYT